MSEMISPTSLTFDGPFLIDSAKLLELDQLIDAQLQRLVVYRNTRFTNIIEREIKSRIDITGKHPDDAQLNELRTAQAAHLNERLGFYDLSEGKSSITVFFDSDKRLSASCFREAIDHENAEQEQSCAFNASIRCANITASIRLTSRLFTNSLEVSVEPDNIPEARELFTALRRWANSVRPTRWYRLCSQLRFYTWSFYLTSAALLFMALSNRYTVIDPYQAKADELLTSGVTQTNLPHAVGILLALTVKHGQVKQPKPLPDWYHIWLLGGLLCAVLLSFPPKTRIGIGKGDHMIRRTLRWQKFITYTIPTVVFTTFVWPSIAKFISATLNLPH